MLLVAFKEGGGLSGAPGAASDGISLAGRTADQSPFISAAKCLFDPLIDFVRVGLAEFGVLRLLGCETCLL